MNNLFYASYIDGCYLKVLLRQKLPTRWGIPFKSADLRKLRNKLLNIGIDVNGITLYYDLFSVYAPSNARKVLKIIEQELMAAGYRNSAEMARDFNIPLNLNKDE